MPSQRSRVDYRPDVPNDIGEKIQLLRTKENRMSTLALEIADLEEEYEEMRLALAPYRVDAPVTVPGGMNPIDKCPDEVLLHLFKAYLEISTDQPSQIKHAYIRRLLLVCRRWNHLIVSTKSLWSRIEIDNPDVLFEFVGGPTRGSLRPYVAACIERSKDLPLDLELILQNFPTLTQYINENICKFADSIMEDYEVDLLSDKISEMEWGTEWKEYYIQRSKALKSLFGEDGIPSARIGSLILTLPKDRDLAIDVLAQIRGPFPNLMALKFLNIDMNSVTAESLRHAFAGLSSITKLETSGSAPLSLFDASPATLQHLAIDTNKVSDLNSLSAFTRLHRLVINCEEGPSSIGSVRTSIFLPELVELSVKGWYTLLREIDLNLPALDLLKIVAEKPSARLPNLLPRHIRWRFAPFALSNMTQEDITGIARDVIFLSNKLQSVTIPSRVKDIALKVVSDARLENAIPSLTDVSIDDRVTELERHEMQLADLGII